MDPVDGCFKLYQTDPGGIMEECICSVGGRDQLPIMKKLKARAAEIWTEERIIQEQDDGGSTTSTMSSISALFQSFSAATAESELTKAFDVWIVRPSNLRRGGIRSACFCNVPRTDLNALFGAIAESAILTKARA
jgi:20S proteasome alpha/beta subunit